MPRGHAAVVRLRRNISFQAAYAAATIGAFVAFLPVLTLILPERVAALTGDNGMRHLSMVLLLGALMASGANILAGLISDALFRRFGQRRSMIAAGMAAVLASYGVLCVATSFSTLLIGVLFFQLSVNMLLAPLAALMVDYVPDDQKGRMAGWLGLALPLGTASVSLVARFPSPQTQLLAVGGLVLALVSPLLFAWPLTPSMASTLPEADQARKMPADSNLDYVRAWAGRFLIQFAAAAIIFYLYYYVSILVVFDKPATGHQVAHAIGQLSLLFAAVSVCAGLVSGVISDGLDGRRLVSFISALMVSTGLLLLAVVQAWALVMVSYTLFAAGLAGFLTSDSALVAQLVAKDRRPATLMGVMNLTNTLPAVLAPAIGLMGHNGTSAGQQILSLLYLSSGAAIVAAFCMLSIKSVR
jgi:MFS family permease